MLNYKEGKMSMKLIPSLLIFFLISCSASVKYQLADPDLRLRNYNNIVLNLVTSSGSLSLSTASLGGIGGAQLMSGNEQGKLALESLQFELMSIGFNFASEENEADAIVEFFIGQIRYDPLAGWIADKALVKFKERSSGRIIAFFQAKGQAITPTVDNIVGNLSKKIKKVY